MFPSYNLRTSVKVFGVNKKILFTFTDPIDLKCGIDTVELVDLSLSGHFYVLISKNITCMELISIECDAG